MKKTQLAAIKSILSKRGKSYVNPRIVSGMCKSTKRLFATDGYVCVIFDDADEEEIEEVKSINPDCFRESNVAPNVSSFLECYENEYHEHYDDYRYEKISVSDIKKRYSVAKAEKNSDDSWRRLVSFDVPYNIEFLKNACVAVGTSKVGVFYPKHNSGEPIVVISDPGSGDKNATAVVMPMAR